MPVLYLATVLLLVVTLLPLWRHPHWVIRAMDFPRLQFAGFALALLVAQLLVLDPGEPHSWIVIITVAACLSWHLWWIAPYTPLWPLEVAAASDVSADRRLSIITANVLTPNRDASMLLQLVARYRPDILLTLESDQWWQERLPPMGSDHFALLTRLSYTATDNTGDTGLEPGSGDQERAKSIVDNKNVNESDVPRPGELN